MSRHLFAAIAALCMSPCLYAADAAKAAAPATAPDAPPAELAQLDFFLGTWSCTGEAFASEMGPAHKTASTVHAARAVGNRWLHVSYDENKTADNPVPVHAAIYMGYDTGKKQFVEGCVDNFGGYCTQSGKGWDGDKLVFEGTANGSGEAFGARDTFTKHGANELLHTGEMQGPDKQWKKSDEETCKKGG